MTDFLLFAIITASMERCESYKKQRINHCSKGSRSRIRELEGLKITEITELLSRKQKTQS
ncbi:hypothetical protein DB317_12720 [Vibrio cholerae]|nr:hypothetical protein DB317_12720 [Vibrio cholerae]